MDGTSEVKQGKTMSKDNKSRSILSEEAPQNQWLDMVS